jgi:hypothetical protein
MPGRPRLSMPAYYLAKLKMMLALPLHAMVTGSALLVFLLSATLIVVNIFGLGRTTQAPND